MKMGARLDGARQVRTRTLNMKALASDATLLKALTAGGEPIAEHARGLVRERTGKLRNSIGVGTQLSPRQASISPKEGRVEVYAGPGALPEAITEEFGTAHETPHPYMRPAWDGEQDTAFDRVVEVMTSEATKLANG